MSLTEFQIGDKPGVYREWLHPTPWRAREVYKSSLLFGEIFPMKNNYGKQTSMKVTTDSALYKASPHPVIHIQTCMCITIKQNGFELNIDRTK